MKGASPLLLAKPFDMSKGVVIDWMHGMLLGVTKKLLDLWLQPSNQGKSFYIGDKVMFK